MDSLFPMSTATAGEDEPVDGGPPARQPPRQAMLQPARLWLQGDVEDRKVRLRNLSPGGVMVDCAAVREPGTPVSLSMDGLGTVAGKVAWCTAGRMGIAFDTPVDPALARDGIALVGD